MPLSGKDFVLRVGLSPFQNIKRLVESFNVKRTRKENPENVEH